MRFCNYIFSLVCICISSIAVNAQVPHIKPSKILDAPIMSYSEYENLYEDIDSGKYTNEEIAKSEAYNGEYTIEDDGEPEPAPTQLDRIEAQTTYTAMMTDTLMEG